MKYGSYWFSSLVREGGRLPIFKGSAFRGGFGHALKKVVCAVRRNSCADCLLRQRCLYARVFEVPAPTGLGDRRRIVTPPHPYVIEPPLTTQTEFVSGDRFDFGLLLFGEFNDYLPYFIYAFEELGKKGLGGQKNPVLLDLESVVTGDTAIYCGAKRELLPGDRTETARLEPAPEQEVTELRIRLLTPLRLKSDNRLSGELPFQLLVRAALRRVSSLFDTFGAGEPALDYQGLVKAAETIDIAANNLHWLDIKRYSSRQDQEMLIGGVSGEIRYRGEIAPYLPILKLAERFHLGKQTSFGLGRIELEF